MRSVKVCSTIGCPEYAPCPHHSRPANAPWSKDRDTAEHLKLRRYLLKTRGAACERCGQQSLDGQGKGIHMHHQRPGNTPDAVILLCANCHRDIDPNAR